jgi:T5SS/PEP-CTERM-associated repeat protein
MNNHLTRRFQRLLRGGSIAVVATLLLPAVLFAGLAEVARAAITTSGNLTGTGTPYNGTDNPWATGTLIVGDTAPGSMTINGGFVVNNTGDGAIARTSASSTSTVTVDGATSTWTNSGLLRVGGLGISGIGGTGILNITGGGSVSNTTGTIGNFGTGTVTVGGGTGASTWTNSESLSVGQRGTGTLNITGGGSVSNASGNIANFSGTGTVNVGGGTGASTWTSSGLLRVGFGGTGTLNITGGGSVSTTFGGTIGADVNGSGTVNVGGGTGASTWTNSSNLTVGDRTTGTLNITGGGSVSNTNATIGSNSGITGTATVGGGTGASTWTNAGFLRVGVSGTGTLNINTGGLVIATALNGGNATSSVKFNGGTLRITATDSINTPTINLLAGGGTFDVPTAATTFTVTTAISGAGGLTKTGGATLELTAANNYGGNTTVHAGTLKLSGLGGVASSPKIIVGDAASSGTHLDVTTKTGGLTIGATQTLAGIGTVDGNTTVLGTHSPGNSPGVQTLNGNMTYASSSTLTWELAANKSTDTAGIRGTDFDGVDVIGAGILTIGSGVTSNLVFNGAGSTVNFANSFWNTSHSWLAFSDANAPVLTSGSIFDTITVSPDSLGGTLSGGAFSWAKVGNDLKLNYTVTAVPEAGAVVVWGGMILVVVGVVALRKKYCEE